MQLVYVDIGRTDQPLTAKLPGNATIKRGDVLRLDADGGDLHIFDGRIVLRGASTGIEGSLTEYGFSPARAFMSAPARSHEPPVSLIVLHVPGAQ